MKSLKLPSTGTFKEAYYGLVAPSHLPTKVQEPTAPVSTAENSSMVKKPVGKENSSSVIRFPGQFPWQLLRSPCTRDSVQWYYAQSEKAEYMEKMRFKDKICLVTGGSSGIGKATSLQLAREGGKVVVMNRDEEEGKGVVAEIKAAGGEAIYIKTDVGVSADVRAAVQQTLDSWGKVDVLINNAAMMTFKPVTEILEEEWEKLMAVNLGGMFLFCKYCIPHMQGGAIVNVSSVHAHQTTGRVAPYAASKGAIEAFTRALSQEVPIKKLRINSVAPGAVNTPMLWSNPNVQNGTEEIEGAVGEPEDLAEAICFLASDEAKFINGTTLVVDGGRLAAL